MTGGEYYEFTTPSLGPSKARSAIRAELAEAELAELAELV